MDSIELKMKKMDLFILSVIPVELAGLAQIFNLDLKDGEKQVLESGLIVHNQHYATGTHKISIGFSLINDAGNPITAAVVTEVIKSLQPDCLCLLGIAAGMRDKTKIGEVILSDSILHYEKGSLIENNTFNPRPSIVSIPFSCKQMLGTLISHLLQFPEDLNISQYSKRVPLPDHKSLKISKEEYRKNIATEIEVKSSFIGSGEKLVKDPAKFYALRKIHNKVEVIEMESAGFQTACEVFRKDYFVIRGISDFGDQLKSDHFHLYASTNASVVLRYFIENFYKKKALPGIKL